MSKALLLAQIGTLLYDPHIQPAERLRLEPLLPQMSEPDLAALQQALQQSTGALADTEELFYDVRQHGEAALDWEQVLGQDARAHPFFDLTLENLAAALRLHLVDYVERGVDLKRELELYYRSQEDIVKFDGEQTIQTYDYAAIREVALGAVRACQQRLSREPASLAVQVLVQRYDTAYSAAQVKRAGIEEASFIDQQRLPSDARAIARTVLAFYDYVVYSGTVMLSEQERQLVVAKTTEVDEGAELGEPTASASQPPPPLPPTVQLSPPPATPRAVVPTPSAVRPQPRTVSSASGTPLPPGVPDVLKMGEPAFFFDLSDEREADQFRQASPPWGTAGNLEQQLRALADQVITANKFSFKEEVSKRRFVNLFVSRLKDVRSVVDARELLLKPVASGGLGLAPDKAEQVITIIERAKQELAAHPLPATPLASLPVVVPPAPAALPAGPVMPRSEVPGSPSGAVSPATLSDWRTEMLEEIARLAPEVPPATAGKRELPPRPQAERPQVMDVKAPPRTLGPLEELKTLSLTDFRRLDPSPVEALAHIRAKIDLIGEASVTRRLQAIRAWQAAPLYQLYLMVGRECIEQGKVVAQVAADREARGEPTLSEAEFDAIVDFNTKLRF